MNWIIWILFGVCGLILVLSVTGLWRYVLTGYLIARVSPYEQPGTGAGDILILGDSTGYGTGATKSEDSIAGRIGAEYPRYSISNNSKNGRVIEGARDVMVNLRQSKQYDLMVLQIGANDLIAGRPVDVVVGEMQQLIERVLPVARNIVIISAGNIGATPIFSGSRAGQLQEASKTYDQEMKVLADAYNQVYFVSLYDDPIEDPFVMQPKVYTSIDGLHPTSAGYGVWHQKAQPYLADVLR